MLKWLLWMRRAAPHLALRTEVWFAENLLSRVAHGSLEIAVVYAPQHRPELRIELLLGEKLVMGTTSRRGGMPKAADYVYVYVDWGRKFAAQHNLAFLELSSAGVSTTAGPLDREYVLAAGGAGCFRLDVVRGHIESGALRRVKGAPESLSPAYADYSETSEKKSVAVALAGLKHVARANLTKVQDIHGEANRQPISAMPVRPLVAQARWRPTIRPMESKSLLLAGARRFVAASLAHCAASGMKGVSATRRWKTALLLQPAAHS